MEMEIQWGNNGKDVKQDSRMTMNARPTIPYGTTKNVFTFLEFCAKLLMRRSVHLRCWIGFDLIMQKSFEKNHHH